MKRITAKNMEAAAVEYAELYPIQGRLRKQLKSLGITPKKGFNAMVEQYYREVAVPMRNKQRMMNAGEDELFTSSYEDENNWLTTAISGAVSLASSILGSQSSADKNVEKKTGYKVMGGTMKYVRENYPNVDFTTLINTNNQAALAEYFTIVSDTIYPADWVSNGSVNIPEVFANNVPKDPSGGTTAMNQNNSETVPLGALKVTPTGIGYSAPANGRVNTTPTAPTTASMLSGETMKIVIYAAVAFVLYKVFTSK